MCLIDVKKTRLAIFIMLWLSKWMIFTLMSIIPICPTRCCNHVTSFGLLVNALYSILVDDNVIKGYLELQVIGLSMSWKIKTNYWFSSCSPIQFESMQIEWKRFGFPSLNKIPKSCVPFKYLSIYVCKLKIRFSWNTCISY